MPTLPLINVQLSNAQPIRKMFGRPCSFSDLRFRFRQIRNLMEFNVIQNIHDIAFKKFVEHVDDQTSARNNK